MIDSKYRGTYQKLVIAPILRRSWIQSVNPLLLTLCALFFGLLIPLFLYMGFTFCAFACLAISGFFDTLDGSVARYLDPKPRDYRQGIFKFTSTPYGSYPRHADLLLTLRRGVLGTSMPSFAELPRDELEAVVEYVLLLTHRGELERELEAAKLEALLDELHNRYEVVVLGASKDMG